MFQQYYSYAFLCFNVYQTMYADYPIKILKTSVKRSPKHKLDKRETYYTHQTHYTNMVCFYTTQNAPEQH